MTVTINTIGDNSRQLVISGEIGPMNIINSINTALTDLSQSLIDTISSGSRNCFVTKVYSALNNDVATGGPTTKYMILRYDTPKQLQQVSCCEGYNTETHVITNECFTNGRSIPLPFMYENCTLYVFASARYAAFLGSVSSEYSAQQGVFEFEREAPEDTATLGYPCFGQTSSLNIGEPWAGGLAGATSTYGSLPYIFSVPRSRTGNTGFAAIQDFTIHTAFGMYPPNTSVTTLYGTTGGITAAVNTHNGHLGAFSQGQGYRQDGGKKIASSLKLAGFNSAYPVGRIYGLTVIPPTGAILDTVVLPIGADGFFDADGTNVNTFLLPISGGYADTPTVMTNGLTLTAYNGGPAFTINQIEILKGRFVYMATSGGIVKLDLSTGVYTTISTASIPIQDVEYDGGLYLYFSTSAGVTRLAIADDSLTNVTAGTGGCSTIALDDTYVYAAHRTTSTTPKLDVINMSTFTVERTYTSTYTMTTAQIFTSLCTVDYSGYIFAANPINSGPTVGDPKIFKILGSNGTSTYATPTQKIASSTGGFMFYDGKYIMLCYSAANYGLNAILPATLADGMTAVTGTATSYVRTGLLNSICPFKGHYVIPISTANKMSAFYNKLNQASPTALPVQGTTVNQMTLTGIGTPSAATSDACCLYIGATGASFYKVGNAHNVYNNVGQLTANILIKS